MTTPGVSVHAVSKRFRRGPVHDSLRDLLPALARRLLGRPARDAASGTPPGTPQASGPQPTDFWALRDVSFEVGPGDALGVIGANGAGKSTLVKIVSQILAPTSGATELRGRVGALLDTTAGFHRDLTGRQNVFLQGAAIGMRKAEIAREFDSIVAFAGVEPFVDTPVKHYSTGMRARLGFAIAAHLDTEVLLIDEVLTVGDLAFQERAYERIQQMIGAGVPVVIVTHQLERMTALCTRAIVLDAGRIVAEGAPDHCVAAYAAAAFPPPAADAARAMRIDAVTTLSPMPVPSGDRVRLRVCGRSERDAARPCDLQLRVRSARTGRIAFATLASSCGVSPLPGGAFELEIELQLNVEPGLFLIECAVHDAARRREVAAGPTAHVRVSPTTRFTGPVQMNPVMRLACPTATAVETRPLVGVEEPVGG